MEEYEQESTRKTVLRRKKKSPGLDESDLED